MINCEIYREGMCVYIPKNLSGDMAIMQKCTYALYPESIQENMSKNCAMKTTIRKLKEKDRALETKVK